MNGPWWGRKMMHMDYRCLNEVTQEVSYTMPRVGYLLDKLGGTKYLATLDLVCGYCQHYISITQTKRATVDCNIDNH